MKMIISGFQKLTPTRLSRLDVKLLDLKDGPKASAYVSEFRARQLVHPKP